MKLVKVNFKIVPINSVKLWKDNPRKNDKSSEKLAELLKVHGIKTPIVVWEKDMTVYKGNTTLKAAKLAGFKEIPIVMAQFKDKSEAVAYALADNKASEWSEWDDTILKKLLSSKEMISTNQDVNTGFSEKELKAFKSLEVVSMDDIPDVDIMGEVKEGGNFIIIRFESEKMYQKIATAFGINKGKRVAEYEDIKEMIQL